MRPKFPTIYLAILAIIFSQIPMSLQADTKKQSSPVIDKKLSVLEVSSGGRLGVSAIDTGSNKLLQYRADERFPMCSTFKSLLVATVLKKNMSDTDLLKEQIRFDQKDIESAKYSPITENHLSDGMTIAQLCEATIQHSDNTAANLLMKKIGGPQVVTQFLRSMGDGNFRLDRWEPELNSAVPGDPRDTSTPASVGNSLRQVLLSDVLGQAERIQLATWLKGNRTGDTRIRAGVPKGWSVGDKTGTCSYGTTNDIGIIWPPKGDPIILAIYFTQKEEEAKPRNDIIAAATRVVFEALK